MIGDPGTQTIKLYGDFFVAVAGVQAKRPESVKSQLVEKSSRSVTRIGRDSGAGQAAAADGKIKACVPLLDCSPTGNQEYKICLESCETGGRGVEFGRKISFFILG